MNKRQQKKLEKRLAARQKPQGPPENDFSDLNGTGPSSGLSDKDWWRVYEMRRKKEAELRQAMMDGLEKQRKAEEKIISDKEKAEEKLAKQREKNAEKQAKIDRDNAKEKARNDRHVDNLAQKNLVQKANYQQKQAHNFAMQQLRAQGIANTAAHRAQAALNAQAKAAARAAKQNQANINKGLLMQGKMQNNLAQASWRAATVQKKALGGIAASINKTINQQATTLANTAGPAGRAKALVLRTQTAPAMIAAAQQAYLARQVGGANAAMAGLGPIRTGGVAGAMAGAARQAPAVTVTPPPPKPSRLTRAANWTDGKLDRLIEHRNNFNEVNSGSVLDKLSMALKGNAGYVAAGAAASAATATLGASMGMLGGAIGVLKEAFMATWNYIDTKVLPTQSMLNRALGTTTNGMGALQGQAMGTALQFERLGLGFEHGASTVKDMAVALKSATIPADAVKSLVTVSEYVGVGGEQAGKLGRAFLSTGIKAEHLGSAIDDAMIGGARSAQKFNIPIALVQKQFASNIPLAARWGLTNHQAFTDAIALADKYNLEIGQMEEIFGKRLDTYEETATMTGQLNQMFGTSLDAMKLLGENSDERMMDVRNAIKGVGLDINKTDKFSKNLLMSITGIKDESQLIDIFGDESDLNRGKKRIDQQKQMTYGLDQWKAALGSLGTQLTSIEQLTRNFFMAIGNVIARLFGFKSGIDATKKGVKAFEGFMDNLTGKINSFADSIPEGDGNKFTAMVDTIITGIKNVEMTFYSFMEGIQDTLSPFNGGAEATSIAEKIAAIPNDNSSESNSAYAALTTDAALHPLSYERAARRMHITPEAVVSRLNHGLSMSTYGYDVQKQGAYTAPANAGNQSSTHVMNMYMDSTHVSQVVAKKTVAQGLLAQPTPRGVPEWAH